MKALDLRRTMGPALIPPFDYAALGDAEVERKLRETAARIRDLQRAAVVDIGRALLAVKDALDHGKFIDWIEAEFPFGRRTAVNMMQVAATFGDKWETVSHLPPTVLYRLAAPSTPTIVRDAVLDLRPGEVVTPRGVQAAIDATRKVERQKDRRDRRDEIRQEQEVQRARWEARDAKDRAARERAQQATDAATERVKVLLADLVPELSDILLEIEPFTFGTIVREMVAAHRAQIKKGSPS